MNIFDTREEAFETQFAHEEEMRFRAQARRDKLMGLWAAERMGLQGEAAKAYAAELVTRDILIKGDDDILERLRRDLIAAGVDVSAAELHHRLDQLMALAMEQVRAGI